MADNKISYENVVKVCRAWNNGTTDVDALCKMLGYKRSTVIRYLQYAGIKRDKKDKSLGQKALDIIGDLKSGDFSQADIARKYGVSRQYVLKLKRGMEQND